MTVLTIMRMLQGGLWLMDSSAAEQYRILANKIINGEPFSFQPRAFSSEKEDGKNDYAYKPVALSYTAGSLNPRQSNLEKAAPGSVALIPIRDVIMQEDYCGSPGLKTIRSWMTKAEENKNIIGQIIYMDSPGGSAQGVDEFSAFVKTLSKPVVTLVDGLACSAGYWISSAGREIICADKHAVLGSIGAFSTFYDDSKAMERWGYREIQVYAPQSGKKNKIFRDITSNDPEVAAAGKSEYANRFLAPLVEDFHNTVKTNRAATASRFTDAVLAGDIFNSTEAINVGLADSIGNLAFALQRVQQLSKTNIA